jgi:Family of unknown function (DUF6011)
MQVSVSDHKFATIADAKEFALAGSAIFTLESLRTGEHFTYKVRAKQVAGPIRADYQPGQVYFVSLLSGPDNENDYFYLGLIRDGRFFLTGKSRCTANAPSFKAFSFFWDSAALHPQLVVRHEGRCGRCGRTLTVPESIDRGIGPECASKMA